ncbi:MAG: PAS domain S-box protein [Nevskia sp.]|nr:PAS domain S-box protein [Gammaproteobacteria bacterium]MDH4459061.1 PAS domain S-box protein [Nevskia sp.]
MSRTIRSTSQRIRDLSIGAKLGMMVATFLVSATAALAIVVLSFTVSSGVRAYVGAESQWSKGQKDAVYAITRYLHTGDRQALAAFSSAIAIPLGDRRARLEMLKPEYDQMVVYQGFLAGGVQAADIPEMIFLFRNLRQLDFLARAVNIWAAADACVQELLRVSEQIARADSAGMLDATLRRQFLTRIDGINRRVTPLEHAFSTVMAEGSRHLQWLLMAIIIGAAGVMLTLSLSVAWLVSRDLRSSIDSLREGTKRVARGDLSTRIEVRSADELGVLAADLNEMVARRREAEVALKAATEFREKIMENATNAIYSMDCDGRFMTANRRTCEITGYTLDELLGMRWFALISERAQLDLLMPKFRDTLEGGRPITDHVVSITRKDGRVVTIQFSTAALSRDGQIFAVVGAAEDITARKRDEAELKARADELVRSNQELEQFAYVASHDLQEPLRTVSGFAQLLQRRYEGKLGADADEYIGYVTAGVQRMKSLIEDLLAYSRVSRGSEPAQPVALNQVVDTALANLQGAITAASAVIRVGELPTVPGNDRQLVQLFQNLIGNAVKFRTEETPRIEIGARPSGNGWIISVRDNGIGIDAKHADQVFVLFQRLNARDKYPGNGIGLTICKKIVDLHRGRISVEPGVPGTVFKIELPA